MPTKKRVVSKKAVAKEVTAKEKQADNVLTKLGLNPRMVTAAILTIIGALLVIWNIAGLLFVFVGGVLIYVGLKMFNIDLKF